MQEIGRERLIRRPVHQYRDDVIAVVCADKIADLLLAPFGKRQIRRTDHDQVFGMIKRVIDAVGQTRRNRQFILVAEDHAQFFAADALPEFRRHHVILDTLLDPLRRLLVQRGMPVADKGDKRPFRRLCFHSFSCFPIDSCFLFKYLYFTIFPRQLTTAGGPSRDGCRTGRPSSAAYQSRQLPAFFQRFTFSSF